jgi:hypothetical protein
VHGRGGENQCAWVVALNSRIRLPEDDWINIHHAGSILLRIARAADVSSLVGQHELSTQFCRKATVAEQGMTSLE